MAIGYLTIQARTAHEAIPLGGVRIRVLDDEGRSVYELTTDENGEAQLVSLETVSRELSLDPYYGGAAYVGYDVFAQAAGFHPIHVVGIPIYERETAILPLVFVPVSEGQRSTGATEIVVGRPAASMREARYQEAPVEEPRVLRQVIIPNPITVHLGRPAAYASNVQVSFPDYVKNVASSEIYPTWPEASMRANIYAIITFALNRVFTEWYRSQGYDFDITNSTAYDQAFVYGRPIYESISRVADDIFNEYVRRQGQIAPYFTSFCNGTTTTCSGLSQWGTVTLANQGLTPLQILRTYYPDDVEIATSEIVANVPSSYPGSPLRQGSTGLDVQTIQTYLNRIRRNYPAIPVITDEAGVFGNSTKAAVTRFQSIFQLAADGIVGKATWYKISQLYAAVTRLSDLNSEGTTLGIGTVPPASVLRQGSRGTDVITLQYLLDVIAEYYPSVPDVSQDGIFGNATRQAVIAFQQTKGLTPDGIVGAATWKALYDAYRGIGDYVPDPGPDTGTMEYVVRAGDTLWLLSQRYGTTVAELKRLNNLTSDELSIGQILRIPTGQTPSYFEYTVRAGDTLWLLSKRYGTTVEAIKSLNGLTGNLLNIGQVLLIPR